MSGYKLPSMATNAPEPRSDLEYAEQRSDGSFNGDLLGDTRDEKGGVEYRKAVPQWNGQRPSPKTSKRKTKVQDDSILAAMCAWIVEHQIGLSMNLLSLLALTHMCFPRARRQTRKFFELSYYNASSGRYGLGWDDIFMVFFWIIAFTGLRVAVMDYLLVPLAQGAGLTKKKEKMRFAEQTWLIVYHGTFWSLGMFIMYNSDYWLNFPKLWANWPDREVDGLCKRYYLVQFAFWLQQILVVNIEERRSDHVQMFTHHIITCVLMLTSYAYHQTKVGNLILCLMDVVDLVFSSAKILKYLKYRVACDIAFGIFMVTWFVTRHLLYLRACYSIYADIPREINLGCYWGSNKDLHGPIEPPDTFNHLLQPFQDPEGMVCWTTKTSWIFLGMLLFLQVILLVWFGMIMRVAWKVIQGGGGEDPRSDDEGEEEDDEELARTEEPFIEVPPLEEEVGVESINLNNRKASPARRFRKGAGTASGVTLHSDRKELLGRIGCDKGA